MPLLKPHSGFPERSRYNTALPHEPPQSARHHSPLPHILLHTATPTPPSLQLLRVKSAPFRASQGPGMSPNPLTSLLGHLPLLTPGVPV